MSSSPPGSWKSVAPHNFELKREFVQRRMLGTATLPVAQPTQSNSRKRRQGYSMNECPRMSFYSNPIKDASLPALNNIKLKSQAGCRGRPHTPSDGREEGRFGRSGDPRTPCRCPGQTLKRAIVSMPSARAVDALRSTVSADTAVGPHL